VTARATENAVDGDPANVGDEIADAYVVERHLGRGASGVVYAARRKREGDVVALKIIHPELCNSRQVFGRYKREATILKMLDDDRIVKFFDFVEHEGLLAIALEYVRGASLDGLLSGDAAADGDVKLPKPLPLDVATDLAIQICDGLAVAHDVGIVHRDLKPANVMIERSPGGSLRARILDFGLAKVVHGEHLVTGLTERDMIFGTPEYMAPEQARGDDVDARCDIYACGAMLYEMATGSVPVKGSTPLATMTAQLVEAIEPPRARAPGRNIPPALEAVILRALEKEPDRRYASARELATALEAACERRVISVTPNPGAGGDISDLDARDTELALRRSQIKAAGDLLEEAEKLAKANQAPTASGEGSAPPTGRASDPRTSSLSPYAPAQQRGWIWPVVSIVAIGTCIALGVLLALK
jgi:eukaryotic-like serine/threonine-protein kinase